MFSNSTNLSEWLDSCSHMKLKLAQFTRFCVCTFNPLLQTGLMHILQASRAYAWRDEWSIKFTFTMADSTYAFCNAWDTNVRAEGVTSVWVHKWRGRGWRC